MYIHYARIELNGKHLVQLLLCSKDYLDYSFTEQKNKAFITKDDWQSLGLPFISGFLKQIPSAQRVYDNENKVWTILESKWDTLVDIVKVMGFKTKSYTDLYKDLIDKVPAQYAKTKIPDATEFFYDNSTEETQNAIIPDGLTKEQIEEKIRFYLQIPDEIKMTTVENDLKKLYRKAAMKYHPDLNGGDASKMTELNYYWQEWQKVRLI